MFRLWGKIVNRNKIVQDSVFNMDDSDATRTKKIVMGLDHLCMTFDLQVPMWFDKNKKDMKYFGSTQFHKDQFIEHIDFDYFEIDIIEED